MTIEELAVQYRETADGIYARVRALRREYAETKDSEKRKNIRRDIRIMLRMYRDTSQMASHLENYYTGRRDERFSV